MTWTGEIQAVGADTASGGLAVVMPVIKGHKSQSLRCVLTCTSCSRAQLLFPPEPTSGCCNICLLCGGVWQSTAACSLWLMKPTSACPQKL